MNNANLKVEYVSTGVLRAAEYNPRSHSKEQSEQLKESVRRFGLVDPIICNRAAGRENVIIGGHFRFEIAKEMGFPEMPVVFVDIPSSEKERELNIRLNKNTGEFDMELLAEFDESFLKDVGFSSVELDEIFEIDEEPEAFNLEEELAKMDISSVEVKPGDIYEIAGSRLMCGDSCIEADVLALAGGEKADMALTDPPYILEYLKTKGGSKAAEGFGEKRNRKYLGTDSLPDDFTELWMGNVSKVQKEDFHIIVYENWKNIRTIWGAMEEHWKVRNMIVWHVTNRSQGASGKYSFYNKHDIAMVGASRENPMINAEAEEDPLLQSEYETALYAVSGKPHWEGYGKGNRICPTDFIEYQAANAKTSGQSVIFGTKPVELLIPYIKVLTKRGDLVIEPFGGSGSTLIASLRMKRRCLVMEKSPVYAEVIKKRWENLTKQKAVKIHEEPDR